MEKVKVSIVVPVCNVEQYLRECLDSIINQTLKEIEIICVNDGSKDHSLDILREYENKDARIIVIDKPNAGYGHTMNVGFDRATGEYIGIVESDDFVSEDMYETLYNIAVENRLDWIKADFYDYVTNPDGTPKLTYEHLSKSNRYYGKVICPNDNLGMYKSMIKTWSGIYRTEFIRTNNIRHNETPGASYQDNGFFFQTFAWAKRAFYLDKPLYRYRCDNPNASQKSLSKAYCSKDEYEFIWDFLQKNPELKKKLTGIYWARRFMMYDWTYKHTDENLRLEYLRHFSDVFAKAQKERQLVKALFTEGEWNTVMSIIRNPNEHHLKRNRSIICSKHNKFVGFLHRFLWCVQDHGIWYTLKYMIYKIWKAIKPKSWTYLSAPRAHIYILARKLLDLINLPNCEMNRIKELKGIHNGERCFITCTGPSLRINDLEKLEHEYTFGVNTIFLAYSQTNWRPTYYAIVDGYIAKKYMESYKMDFENFSKRDIFLNSYIRTKKLDKIHKCHIDFRNHTKSNLNKNHIYVDDNIHIHIYDCFTVTNMAINIAVFMGFKEIYIIGADCNFDGAKLHFIPNSFDPTSPKKNRYQLSVERSINGYMALKKYAEERGVKIYNATRGGKLEVFERIDFDSIKLNLNDEEK